MTGSPDVRAYSAVRAATKLRTKRPPRFTLVITSTNPIQQNTIAMRQFLSYFSTGVLTFVCSMASDTQAADWPQYRGPRGDGKSSETIVSDFSRTPKILWKVKTPLGFSSFAIADGRAFTLVAREVNGRMSEICIALDSNNGEQLWEATLGPSDYDHDGGNSGARGNRGGDGPRSTPATDGQHVFVYDAHMVLTCFSASDGELLWQRDIQRELAGRSIKWLNATSPVLDGDKLYVGGGGSGQTFLAFDKSTGGLLWKSGDETITHATPCVATIHGVKQVIFFAQSGLVGVDSGSGQELWRRKFNFAVSSAASPVTENDLVYCSAGYGVGAGLFQIKKSSDDSHQVDRVWLKRNKLMNHWSTPVARNGFLYGIFEFKKYGDAPLNCVDLATGNVRWSHRGFGPGNCILVGDKLVVLSDTGEVVIAKAEPESYAELARVKAVDGKCWSTPAYSDGRIFLRSTKEAACMTWAAF